MRSRLQVISILLRCIFPLFLMFLPLISLSAQEDDSPPSQSSDIETLTELIVPEDSSKLFNINLWDADVSLFLSGYWKGTLGGNLGFSLTPLGPEAASTDSPILFTQETDLTLSLWIKDKWFVEASFLDDYNMNTYRAGYEGGDGDFIQYIGIGNTGLDFPSYPYLDLGGDSGSSAGIYGRFGTETVTLHSMFRYDAAVREERIYVGDRERSYSYLSVENPIRGRSFVLPDEALNSIPIVYLEDAGGEYTGSDKRRYRRASNSELAASAEYGIVELADAPLGRVLVSYHKNGSNKPWETSMGNYASAGFLKEVQDYFTNAYDLTKFAQPGQEVSSQHFPGTIMINGSPALAVYEPGTFSPFERQSRYAAPSSNTASADFVRLSTEEKISGYEVLPLESLITSSDVQLAVDSQSQRDMYELTKHGNFGDRRSLESRWPLADMNKEIYLPLRGSSSEDMSIRFTNYGGGGAYSLGTDIVPGSVKVFRGGIEDSRFSFDAETGIVSLETPAGFNETVRITYLKQYNQRDFGSLAGGIGLEYDPAGPFSSALAIGVRWNINDNAFSETGSSNEGTAGLSGQAAWSEENLNVKLTLGAVLDQGDTTGLYRISGMEETTRYIDIQANNSFISEAPASNNLLTDQKRAGLVYRDYRESNALGSSSLNSIGWGGAEIIRSKEGPYPVWDNTIDHEVIAAEFSLNSEKTWTGFQSPLGDDHGLNNAEQIQVPLRFYDFGSSDIFDITIQFGALKDQDNRFGENPEVIVTKTFSSSSDFNVSGNFQSLLITLTNSERGKLKNADYMRIFIDGKGNNIGGRIIAAPPIIFGAAFRPIDYDYMTGSVIQSHNASAKETIDNSLRSHYPSLIDKLHPDNAAQRVLTIDWDEDSSADTAHGVDTRVPWIPLINYDTLSFFVKGPEVTSPDADETDKETLQNAELHFHITQGPSTINHSGKTRLSANIPVSAFTPGEWSKVEIKYNGSSPEVKVAGTKIENAYVRYNPNQEYYNDEQDSSGQQSYLALFIKPKDGDALPAASFSVDEIILEHSISSYRFNVGTSADWHIPGTILSLGKFDLLKDLTFQSALETAFRVSPEQEHIEHFAGLLSNSKITGTVLDTLLSFNLRLNAGAQNTTWNAGYEIDRDFGPLSFSEQFQSGSLDASLWHDVSLDLSPAFGTTKIEVGIEASAEYENTRLNRIWETYTGWKPSDKNNSGIRADFFAGWLSYDEDADYWSSSFGDSWLRSWEAMMPDDGRDADRRSAKLSLAGIVDTKPLGANIYLEAESIHNRIQSTTLSDSAVRLELPFSIGKTYTVFQLERGFNWGLHDSGKSFHNDADWFMKSLETSAPLWASIPLYSLFDPALNDSMQSVYDNSNWKSLTDDSRFHDLAGINIQLPLNSGLPSFFIPSSFDVTLKRSLHQKLDTISDVLNLGASVDFSAVNMFGAFGTVPIMRIYQSDEFSNRLEIDMAFPRDEDVSWQMLAGQSMSFFGFTEAVLNLNNTLSFSDEGWSETLKIDWLVPTKKSLLSLFYSFLMGKAAGLENFPALSEIAVQPFSQLRNETLELSISESDKELVMNLVIRHESIIRLEGRLHFSVFAELSTDYYSSTDVLSFIGTIGTSLQVSF